MYQKAYPPTPTAPFADNSDIPSQEHGGGVVTRTIKETVTAAAAGAVNLVNTLPANSRVVGTQIKTAAGVTLATGTHLSVGISGGDLDAFLIVAAASIDAANDSARGVAINTPVGVAAASTIAVTATNSGGSASGTWTGTIVVEVTYLDYRPIADF